MELEELMTVLEFDIKTGRIITGDLDDTLMEFKTLAKCDKCETEIGSVIEQEGNDKEEVDE